MLYFVLEVIVQNSICHFTDYLCFETNRTISLRVIMLILSLYECAIKHNLNVNLVVRKNNDL